MHGLKRRGLETERKPPRQSPTLLRWRWGRKWGEIRLKAARGVVRLLGAWVSDGVSGCGGAWVSACWSGCGGLAGDAGDVVPEGEAEGHLEAVRGCGQKVAVGSEVG